MKKEILFLLAMFMIVSCSKNDDEEKKQINHLQVRPKTIEPIRLGDTIQLKAEILPTDATYHTIEWISGDENIAQVNNNGKLTGMQEGVTTITACVDQGISSTIYIEVLHTFDLPKHLAGKWKANKVFIIRPEEPGRLYNEEEIKELIVPTLGWWHNSPEAYIEKIKHLFSYEIYEKDGKIDCIYSQTKETIPGYVVEEQIDEENNTYPCYFYMNQLSYEWFPKEKYFNQEFKTEGNEIIFKHPMETVPGGYYVTHYTKNSN